MGRKRQKQQKNPTHFSQTEEREKIKQSILKVFRARLALPDQGGALLVGPSKEPRKDQESQNVPEKTQNGYSSDRSSSSMSGQEAAKKKKQSTVKRRKHSSRSKHKSEKKETEVSSAVARHMKVARGVSYSLSKDVVTDKGITNMMTHARITQPVGLINTGRKSAPARRVPLQVPDHIRKQTEEELKKILENDDDRAHPTVSLTEAQSSTVNSIPSTSPHDLDEFPEVLPLKETVVSLVSSLKDANKELYPGRNRLTEVTSELLKLMKQNAPRSATPTPIPVFNKITNSGSVQRKLLNQFPSGSSGRLDQAGCVVNDSLRGQKETHQENADNHFNSKVPHDFHFTDSNPFQPVTQNTMREQNEPGNRKTSSIQNYKNSRPQPDHNLKLLANVLDDLHKGKENRDLRSNAAEMFDTTRNQYYIGLDSRTKKGNESLNVNGFKPGLMNDSFNELSSNKNKNGKPVYILKKHKAPDNLQMLYENARILQLQHKNPRQDIRNGLFKDELEKIFATSRKPDRTENIGTFHRNIGTGQSTNDIVPMFNGKERTSDFVAYLGNDVNILGRNEFGHVFSGVNNEQDTNEDEIVKVIDAKAKKIFNQVDGVCEPMEVDDKIWELDADSLIPRNDLPVDRIKQTGFIGNAGDNVPSFLQNIAPETQSRSSSQCSYCSHTNSSSRYSGSQRAGDILSQVCTKETDYMPSFHGGYCRDERNTKDLMFEQRKNEMQQLDANPMDILDYIDSRDIRVDARPEQHSRLGPSDAPLVHDRHPAAGDQSRRFETVITVEIHSPDEPKLYPRKMY